MCDLLIGKGSWNVTNRTAGEEDKSTDFSKSKQAVSTIILAVEEDQIVLIEECKTAHDA